ncbi:MAG: hypothetical protein J6A75_13370 [Lachnospiraceae bacterium]|nr:hypothetical protein [Lachnospiraceae bacterium]
MAKYYGDIPCTKLDGIIHITTSATECMCGKKWRYAHNNKDRYEEKHNIIWRVLDAVTCDRCKKIYTEGE